MTPGNDQGGEPFRNETPEPALGLPLDRAASMLPADLLHGDEIIVLLLKPSLWFVVLSSLRVLGIVLVIAATLAFIRVELNIGGFDARTIPAIALLAAGLRLFWGLLDWLGRTYVLTDRRIIRIRGVFRIQVFQARLRHLEHTELLLSFRERVLGLGTITISTAGTGYPEAYWVNVTRPFAVHRKITQTISRYG